MTWSLLCLILAFVLFLVAAFEATLRTRGPVVWGWLGLAAFTVPFLIAAWPPIS